MHIMNRQRGARAAAALDTFRTASETEGDWQTISDLIADIGHYCDSKGWTYLPLLTKGIGDWKLEQRDAESMEPRPFVDIHINVARKAKRDGCRCCGLK